MIVWSEGFQWHETFFTKGHVFEPHLGQTWTGDGGWGSAYITLSKSDLNQTFNIRLIMTQHCLNLISTELYYEQRKTTMVSNVIMI